MNSDDAIRASDGDREKAVAILRDAYATGRLTLAEFDDRTSAAFASRTWGELRKLTSDLPVQPALGPGWPAPAPAAPAGPAGSQPAAGEGGGGRVTRPGLARLLPALPIVFVWVAISLYARSPGAYVPIVVLLLMGLKLAGGRP